MFRRYGWFRLPIRLYVRGFRKTPCRPIRLEPGGYLARLRACSHDGGLVLARIGPVDRPFWPSSNHSPLYDRVWVRDRLTGVVALRIVAVLPDLRRYRHCGQ